MWTKIRAVLAVLTDLLNIGRGKGWWEKNHVPGVGPDAPSPTSRGGGKPK